MVDGEIMKRRAADCGDANGEDVPYTVCIIMGGGWDGTAAWDGRVGVESSSDGARRVDGLH